MSTRLHQLPNGSWIDPAYILMVEAVDAEDDELIGGFYAPRVIIHLRGDRRVIECANFKKACEVRDKIAKLCIASVVSDVVAAAK